MPTRASQPTTTAQRARVETVALTRARDIRPRPPLLGISYQPRCDVEPDDAGDLHRRAGRFHHHLISRVKAHGEQLERPAIGRDTAERVLASSLIATSQKPWWTLSPIERVHHPSHSCFREATRGNDNLWTCTLSATGWSQGRPYRFTAWSARGVLGQRPLLPARRAGTSKTVLKDGGVGADGQQLCLAQTIWAQLPCSQCELTQADENAQFAGIWRYFPVRPEAYEPEQLFADRTTLSSTAPGTTSIGLFERRERISGSSALHGRDHGWSCQPKWRYAMELSRWYTSLDLHA